ncbi:hypothetical protein bcere0012_5840 [Bacillus cereus BDRD-ST24]|nr:hypothetical protein bcere0012_5840 [Bacillus cereus BDRD-ST24]
MKSISHIKKYNNPLPYKENIVHSLSQKKHPFYSYSSFPISSEKSTFIDL